MKRLATLTASVLFLLTSAVQASAAGGGFIEGGNIYAAFPASSSITYKIQINNPGVDVLHGVIVTATEPTHGSSSVRVCSKDGAPRCATDSASVVLSTGQTLTYESGSLKGATGNIFTGASVGTVTPGFSGIRYVQFTMVRHNPAPVAKPQPTHPAKPAPVATTKPTHKQPVQPTSNQPKPAETLPPVTFTGTTTAPTTVASAPAQPVTQPTSTPQVTPALSVSGIENPFIPLFATSIGGGAYALRRSRRRLVESILR
jgi:hypothetical protein